MQACVAVPAYCDVNKVLCEKYPCNTFTALFAPVKIVWKWGLSAAISSYCRCIDIMLFNLHCGLVSVTGTADLSSASLLFMNETECDEDDKSSWSMLACLYKFFYMCDFLAKVKGFICGTCTPVLYGKITFIFDVFKSILNLICISC